MIKLDVLAIGSFKRDEDGKIYDACSSSVLIRTDERLIVVDTSSEYLRPAIKTAFKQIGVFPKDVDTVILTHSHHDHVGNNDMFEDAAILLHPAESDKVEGAKPLEVGKEFIPGIKIVHTPGHTEGSISVFIKADMKYVIAGDALPRHNNYLNNSPPAINYDPALALESIKMITKYADVIIPGHDSPFLVNR